MSWTVRHGDCRQLLRTVEPESIDSCPTDPPYGLSFMGRGWDNPDNVAFRPETWRLVLRALKPGAHLLAFGGTRTFHRLTCAIEDAGFEVRDVLCWLYGQGMPKSHDVSKAIDKAAGAEREVVGPGRRHNSRPFGEGEGDPAYGTYAGGVPPLTAPAIPEAKQWDGWGTALSPSWEPIVLARKPLSGTVAANVLEHGTGGLNIDGCRLDPGAVVPGGGRSTRTDRVFGLSDGAPFAAPPHNAGRWPPNVALDEEAAAAVDRQSGISTSSDRPRHNAAFKSVAKGAEYANTTRGHSDTGGASRFFYCPKASTAERNAGLGDEQNPHPTVKPLALMRWLCRLVTPPGGLVLDPFCGSGSTGVAAVLEGFRFLGLEQDAEAVRVARLRIHHRRPNAAQLADTAPPQARQRSLFGGAA
jgi:site-specific DNA-methyltransferase (adenine-specific)